MMVQECASNTPIQPLDHLKALLILNGSAGCSWQYLQERLKAPSRESVASRVFALNKRLQGSGKEVVSVSNRYYILSDYDAQIEREERLYG